MGRAASFRVFEEMSENGSQTTQTTTAQAPSWQQPYQQYGLQQATGQYQNVTSPQQLVAGFSPMQNQAMSNINTLATQGTPEGTAANNYVTNVLSGNPANNPYLNSEFQQGANQVQNQLESEFAGAGRNVLASAPVQSDSLNNLAAQLYGGAYNTGIQQQENASAEAPTLEQNQYAAQQNLYNAGAQQQNLAQQYIQAPQTFLNQYLSQVNGNLGTTSATQQPYSPLLQSASNGLIGSTLGGSLGSAIGNYFGNSTTGSNLGSLAGGLLGAFA